MLDIKGIVFTGSHVGKYANDSSKESLRKMKEQTECNTVVLTISAIQESADSEIINYQHEFMPKDSEIKDMVSYAKSIGLQIILKPGILCLDGTCHSQIDFTGTGRSANGKWCEWFENYTKYIFHYAQLAQKINCDMLMIGCELVKAERQEEYWRQLIHMVREEYKGLLTYNADQYMTENVVWWDALDVICSSGYYPMDEMDDQMRKIDGLVKKYNKPFFFGEVGCKSCDGAAKQPRNWELQGKTNMKEQSDYFNEFFGRCKKDDNISGVAVWNWWHKQRSEVDTCNDKNYSINGKPATEIIKKYFSENKTRNEWLF